MVYNFSANNTGLHLAPVNPMIKLPIEYHRQYKFTTADSQPVIKLTTDYAQLLYHLYKGMSEELCYSIEQRFINVLRAIGLRWR